MCSSSTDMQASTKQHFIRWITPDEVFPEIIDPFADLYKSTDYRKDKTFRAVQTATIGKGIDLVIMGDAYSDRLIESGKYDQDLERAIEHIFSEEPLKSLREYFTVYISYAVSENETAEGITAFDLVFEDNSSHISGGDDVGDDYMRAILPDYGWEWVTGRPTPFIIIVSNCNRFAGTANFYTSGSTLVLCALGSDDTDYHASVCHEFGHVTGLLADEYAQYGWTFTSFLSFREQSENGFWPNLDITNDPSMVKWSSFLNDERYSTQGLGLFEGGAEYYSYGIWRPTENSIMNDATTGFNAPSREAIYKRVHELAEDSFVYDYEQFVAFDLKAMGKEPSPMLNRIRRGTTQTPKHLPPPVFVDGATNSYGASTTIRLPR